MPLQSRPRISTRRVGAFPRGTRDLAISLRAQRQVSSPGMEA